MSDDTYLITSTEIQQMEGLAKTHFLNPKAKRINKSLGDLAGLTGFGFHLIEVQPGDETTEHHRHHHEDECVYVLSGTATSHIGEETQQIGPGDFIGYRKGGLAHSIVNTGDEPFVCIVVGQRLPHDVGDYTRKGKRIYRNEGLAWNLVDHDQIEEVGGNAGKK
ncbi:MAG: cupin domain-containing protein [Sulfitobacter sp.]